ncbi:hypothetical protein UlMin_031761 [Ulmus minor]
MNTRKRNRQEEMELEAAGTGMTNLLWNKYTDQSNFALYSPFFVCLAAGNLASPAFCHCLNQELHFLHAFVQACEMAEESEESEGRQTAMRILKERERKKIEAHYTFIHVSAQQCEGLLEYMSSSLNSEELEILEKLYHQALKLNVEFFVAQPISQPTIAPLLHMNGDRRLALFCGFDETCIPYNSPTILSLVVQGSARKRGEAFHKSADELKGIWDLVITAYGNKYDELMKNVNNSNETGGVFNYEGITRALEDIGEFDKEATAKVEEFGLFKDLTLDNITRVGQHLGLHNGCQSFLEKTVENPRTDVHVLSYSWCGDLVKAAFSSGGFDRVLNIHSNEFAYEDSVSTGRIIKKIESATDRLKAMKVILNSIQLRDKRIDHLKVYIGGTVSELLCLLEADIGIVIDPKQSLRSFGNRFGVSFVPLFPALVRKQKQPPWGAVGSSSSFPFRKPLSGILYTVSSWSEIHAFILGV